MDKDFVATLSFVVNKADGTPFAEFHHKYHNMDLPDIVEFEDFLWKVLGQMNDWGKAKVAEKQSKGG